jgi:hypothetical protein
MSIKPFKLLEGEEIHWRGKFSWKANWLLILICIALLPIPSFFLIGGIGFLIIAFLRTKRSIYAVTNYRVIVRCEFYNFYAVKTSIGYDNIADIIVKQGFMGRLLNYGRIFIFLHNPPNSYVIMPEVPNPKHVGRIIAEHLITFLTYNLMELEANYNQGYISKENYWTMKNLYERQRNIISQRLKLDLEEE